MIRNFSDHSANERTFLAWIRTAVAIMGFGFIVEKLGVSGPTAAGQSQHALIPVDHVGAYTGLALIFVGLTLIVDATIRFITMRRLLVESLEMKSVSVTIDLSLAGLLALLGLALAVYMLQLVVQ